MADDLPPERPRRRKDEDFDERPPQKSGKTNVNLILLVIGGFVVSTACAILGGLALMGMAMRMTPNNVPITPPNPPPAVANESTYKPLKTNVDRDRFRRELIGKPTSEVITLLGTPMVIKTDPKDFNLEWWYYTGANPQTGIQTKLPNTMNGAFVKLEFMAGRMFKIEWEPKQ